MHVFNSLKLEDNWTIFFSMSGADIMWNKLIMGELRVNMQISHKALAYLNVIVFTISLQVALVETVCDHSLVCISHPIILIRNPSSVAPTGLTYSLWRLLVREFELDSHKRGCRNYCNYVSAYIFKKSGVWSTIQNLTPLRRAHPHPLYRLNRNNQCSNASKRV